VIAPQQPGELDPQQMRGAAGVDDPADLDGASGRFSGASSIITACWKQAEQW
jgi:hypothetical protein